MSSRDDRKQAAELLRTARRDTGESAAEAAAWARCLAPESRMALALEITLALRAGDQHHADALIAQGLLQRPNDDRLLWFFARRLLDRGLVNDAERVIERALCGRPKHTPTLMLAGEIARQNGQVDRAIERYEAVAAIAGREQRLAALSVIFRAHLAQNDTDAAARVLRRFPVAPLLLRARLLRAQGALSEAIHMLEARIDEPAISVAERDEILAELIDACDVARDDERILRHVDSMTAEFPRALARAAAALLRMGRFIEVKACAASAGADRTEDAAIAAVIAHMALGASAESGRPVNDAVVPGKIRPPVAASLWRRALLGRLLNEIKEGRASQSESPLADLLGSARSVFAGAGADDEIATKYRAFCDVTLAARSIN